MTTRNTAVCPNATKGMAMSKRPTEHDIDVFNYAASLFVPVLMKEHRMNDDTPEEVEKQIQRCQFSTSNGFEFGKALDAIGWSVDMELCETLDTFSSYLRESHELALKIWIAMEGIEPKHAVGDTVSGKWGFEVVTGRISKIDRDRAVYRVDDPAQKGHAWHVAYEDVLEPITA